MNREEVQQEANEVIKYLPKAGLVISMRVGKTLIALKDMATHYTDISRYLVVAPKTKIFDSWKDDMKKFKCDYLLNHTDFTTYLSLKKQSLDYDVVYLDECHSLKASHNEWLKAFEAKGGRIIGLTGTYPVSTKTEKGKMCYYYCPKVYTYKTDDAVKDNILNNYKIFVHELALSEAKNVVKTGKFGEYKTSEVKEYDYWTSRVEDAESPKQKQLCSIQRMKSMQGFKSKESYTKALLRDQTKKTLAFASTKVQADNICEHSVHSGNKNSNQNLKDFKEGVITKLCAVEQISEGITIPNLEVGIITHSYSNNRKAAQKIGRFLGLNPENTSEIHVLCYADTIDKVWVSNALDSFDQSKIEWIKPKYHAGIQY